MSPSMSVVCHFSIGVWFCDSGLPGHVYNGENSQGNLSFLLVDATLMVVLENYSICIMYTYPVYVLSRLVDLLEVIYLLSEVLHVPQEQNVNFGFRGRMTGVVCAPYLEHAAAVRQL